MTNEENGNINLVPPYGPITRLKYVFDLFSTHTFPRINVSTLKNMKLSGTDASLTVSALKFLGIIDVEGNKTDKMTSLQLKGEEKQKVLLSIVKDSYVKLFEIAPEANKLTRDELYNDFINIYKVSGRQAATAVPNFIWICNEAGLEITERNLEVKSRKVSFSVDGKITKPKSSKSFHARDVAPTESTLISDRAVEWGEFKLEIPKNWDLAKTRTAIATGELGEIYKQLISLSNKLSREAYPSGEGK